jgi:hypothetical protein
MTAQRRLELREQALQDEFYSDILREGIEFLAKPEFAPEARARKFICFIKTLRALAWDEPRLDSLVAEFDDRLDQIVRGLRRQLVRDLFSGKAKPEEAAEIAAN